MRQNSRQREAAGGNEEDHSEGQLEQGHRLCSEHEACVKNGKQEPGRGLSGRAS